VLVYLQQFGWNLKAKNGLPLPYSKFILSEHQANALDTLTVSSGDLSRTERDSWSRVRYDPSGPHIRRGLLLRYDLHGSIDSRERNYKPLTLARMRLDLLNTSGLYTL
jgi:hypothetical protein